MQSCNWQRFSVTGLLGVRSLRFTPRLVATKRCITNSAVVQDKLSLKQWIPKIKHIKSRESNREQTELRQTDESEIPTSPEEDHLSYVKLFKKQLNYLRTTNQEEAAIALFSEITQTGLPVPCILYQEVFLALNTSQRYFQVENMYQEMRQEGVIPDIGCFYIRLQSLINCMDKAREKGEMIFWLDKKLRDIIEEIATLSLPVNYRIYGLLLQLGSKGNAKETLIELWNDYCRLFPNDSPHPRIITTTIRSVCERFEDPAAAVQIMNDAQETYGYSTHASILSLICFRALGTNDEKTALSLINNIQPTIRLHMNVLRCASQTGNQELYEFAWPKIQDQSQELADKLFPWQLYAIAKFSDANQLIDLLCDSPSGLPFVRYSHLVNIAPELFDTTEQIDNAYYYCERKGDKICIQALDLIIVSCGLLNDPERALETYQALSEFGLKPRTATYNAMMNIYLNNEEYQLVPNIFGEMTDAECKPDEESYECLVRTYLQVEEVKLLLETIATATENSCVLPYPVYDEIVRYFVHQGNSSASQFIIRHMKQLNLDTTVIQQFANNVPIKINWQ